MNEGIDFLYQRACKLVFVNCDPGVCIEAELQLIKITLSALDVGVKEEVIVEELKKSNSIGLKKTLYKYLN